MYLGGGSVLDGAISFGYLSLHGVIFLSARERAKPPTFHFYRYTMVRGRLHEFHQHLFDAEFCGLRTFFDPPFIRPSSVLYVIQHAASAATLSLLMLDGAPLLY